MNTVICYCAFEAVNNINLLHETADFANLVVLHRSVQDFLDKQKNWRTSQSDMVTCPADK